MSVALSVLDLAPIGAGQSAADALAGTTQLARRADELGFRRFWVAEHHNIPSVASTAPEVLIAHLAASTPCLSCGCSARPTAAPGSPPRLACRSSSPTTSTRTSRSPRSTCTAACFSLRSCSTRRARSSRPGSSSATTTDGARRALPGGVAMLRLRQGRPAPIPSVEDAEALVARLAPAERAVVDDAIERAIVGGVETVHAALLELFERTGTDELMLPSQVADAGQRAQALERVARAFELAPQPAA